MFPTLFSLEIPFLDITLEPRFYGLFYAIAILIGARPREWEAVVTVKQNLLLLRKLGVELSLK